MEEEESSSFVIIYFTIRYIKYINKRIIKMVYKIFVCIIHILIYLFGPLHLLCEFGFQSIAENLIKNGGADVNLKSVYVSLYCIYIYTI